MAEILSKEEVEKRDMATVAAKPISSSQADLTKQLDKILNDLRELIAKRNARIAELREEIENLENENTQLDAKINAILSDI